jgi:hypothetical protein
MTRIYGFEFKSRITCKEFYPHHQSHKFNELGAHVNCELNIVQVVLQLSVHNDNLQIFMTQRNISSNALEDCFHDLRFFGSRAKEYPALQGPRQVIQPARTA